MDLKLAPKRAIISLKQINLKSIMFEMVTMEIIVIYTEPCEFYQLLFISIEHRVVSLVLKSRRRDTKGAVMCTHVSAQPKYVPRTQNMEKYPKP